MEECFAPHKEQRIYNKH